jgi:ABC-2 type transport system ATP-binding protein
VSWGVRDVCVRFGPRLALDRVSLDLRAGAVTGVVGGDGAGKTTLLRALVGSVLPARGEVRRPPAARLGYLPSGSGTYPDLSVDENLELTARAYGLAPGVARSRAAELLERTGLAGARTRLAGDLSGGMRQKLGVIRALLHRPDLLVLDEPTTGVDPVSRADVWWLVARAAADGAAVVFATTYLDEAERAEHVLALDAGRPLAAGPPGRIVASLPGTITAHAGRPAGEAGRLAWRRRGRWYVWNPGRNGVSGPGGAEVRPDLQDAVTVFALGLEVDRERGEATEAAP